MPQSGRSIATAIIVAFACALTLLGSITWNIVNMLGRSAAGPRPAHPPAVADRPPEPEVEPLWPAAGNTVAIGDLQVTAGWACVQQVGVVTRFGRHTNHGKLLVVALRLANTHPTRVLCFGGWADAPAIQLHDEHGNRYDAVRFGAFDGFSSEPGCKAREEPGFRAGCITTHILMGACDLHPGKCYITHLFFDKPADVASEARLTLPASEAGGSGQVHLRVPICRPTRKQTPRKR